MCHSRPRRRNRSLAAPEAAAGRGSVARRTVTSVARPRAPWRAEVYVSRRARVARVSGACYLLVSDGMSE